MDKTNGTKNALFFLSRAPTHHSFTFNLRFLYEMKYKVRLSKSFCGIFHFRFRFFFIKVYKKCQQKRHNSFKIKIIEQPHTLFLPDLWFLSSSKKFKNSMISALSWSSLKTKLETNFLNLENRSSKNVNFSQ